MKERRQIRDLLWELFLIVTGTAILAFSYQCIFDPAGLVTGGFTGLAIIIKSVTGKFMEDGVPLWLTNLLLNVPVFILGFIRLGKKFIGRTLFGTIMLSVWLYIIPSVNLAAEDYLLAALYGGIFAGIGIGLVLRARATTGGTDLVAALIQNRMRHYSIVQVMQVIDGLVVLAGLYVFGIRPALYAIVAVYVITKVSDGLLEGFKYSKAAYIITGYYDEIARNLMQELNRGVTGLSAKGMYTGTEKCVLYCVVSRKEIVVLKEIVKRIDPDAFVIVSDVREVLGEGFQEQV